ncbi:hypothetical protein C8J56DRAFT_1065134 [Mycena floridula]|nr:hypothetical protein C8J56DRAFT_1065134 [Mycena floridula]
MFSKFTLVALLSVVALVKGESHTIVFDNRCGFGTPTLIQAGVVLSTGGAYTRSGPINSAIAYLQTGSCGFNGDGCTLVETTLVNPTCAGCGSSTDISLVGNHAFSVTSGFGYFNGCDGAGADCNGPNCPDKWPVQVACQSNNVNLAITFCL